MYIAKLLNDQGLFQILGGWPYQDDPQIAHIIEECLFRATCAVISLERMKYLEASCINQYKTQREELELRSKRSKLRIIFWSPTLLEMLSEFSAFLSALRILQNQVIPLAARTWGLFKSKRIKKDVSKSMNDAMKKIDSYGLPRNIVNKLKTYWHSKSGRRVKDYRGSVKYCV
jgi:hypothetical protein